MRGPACRRAGRGKPARCNRGLGRRLARRWAPPTEWPTLFCRKRPQQRGGHARAAKASRLPLFVVSPTRCAASPLMCSLIACSKLAGRIDAMCGARIHREKRRASLACNGSLCMKSLTWQDDPWPAIAFKQLISASLRLDGSVVFLSVLRSVRLYSLRNALPTQWGRSPVDQPTPARSRPLFGARRWSATAKGPSQTICANSAKIRWPRSAHSQPATVFSRPSAARQNAHKRWCASVAITMRRKDTPVLALAVSVKSGARPSHSRTIIRLQSQNVVYKVHSRIRGRQR